MAVFDCHCHVLPPEMVGDLAKYAALDRHFGLLVTTKGAKFATGEDLLRDMAPKGIDRAVIFGYAFEDVGLCKIQNDYVADLCVRFPDKFCGLGVLSPDATGALREAQRCLDLGLSGFGELFPSGHGFSLEGEGMTRLSGLSQDAASVLLIHVNEQVGHVYPGKGDAGPKEAYAFATKNPGAKVIFAHLGGGLPFFFSMPEVKMLTNVYYDTAAQPLLFNSGVYRVLRAAGALDRILFGSDYPLLGPERYVRDLQRSGLTGEEQDMILKGNGLTLFGRDFSRQEEN